MFKTKLQKRNGINLLREICEISSATKIMTTSTDTHEANLERAFSGGALQFL